MVHLGADLLGGRVATEILKQLTLHAASLLMVSTIWTGIRMVRAWSAIARVMAWRIHHVAYVENLKPFS